MRFITVFAEMVLTIFAFWLLPTPYAEITLIIAVIAILLTFFFFPLLMAWRSRDSSPKGPVLPKNGKTVTAIKGGTGAFLGWIGDCVEWLWRTGMKNWDVTAVILAYALLHLQMWITPSATFFSQAWEKNPWLFVSIEVTIFILYLLFRTTKIAKVLLALVSFAIILPPFYWYIQENHPDWDVAKWEVVKTAQKKWQETQWSSKGSSAQAATAPTYIAPKNQVLYRDPIPLTADCGKEGGPVPCFGTVEAFSSEAEGPTENQIAVRPRNASLCWQPHQGKEKAFVWAGNDLEKLERFDLNGNVERKKYHAFSGTETNTVKFLIVRQGACPDYTSWE
jgi:hypothetical protein